MADYDLLIKNGTIVDGLRMPAFEGTLASAAGRSWLWAMSRGAPTRVIDATGLDRRSRLHGHPHPL